MVARSETIAASWPDGVNRNRNGTQKGPVGAARLGQRDFGGKDEAFVGSVLRSRDD